MTAPLHDYLAKRDFSKTSEPCGDRTAPSKPHPLAFVVQKHDARRLHYDFRLELDGVLKSWAVPKGPSDLPSDKRLAVMTEDHPLDYASFEGVIPRGEYGAGSVIVWDRGTWEPEEADPRKALARGRLKFTLHGTKLRGRWALVRMRDADDQWLLIKDRDPWAASSRARPLVDREPASVLSGRRVEEVVAAPRKRKTSPAAVSVLPPTSQFSPALATLVDRAPAGDGWLHEVKYDGYRILARVGKEGVSLITRNGHDWTGRFGDLASAFAGLGTEAIIDGEVVVLDANGLSSFQKLQHALKHPSPGAFSFFAFDLLWLADRDVRPLPLVERKGLLKSLLPDSGLIRFSDHLVGDGPAFHAQACRSGLEGIISKRADSPYSGRRGHEWVKVKCLKRQEFVIGGFTDPGGGRTGFGSLLLGVNDPERGLVYAGKVGTGFDHESLATLRTKLDPIVRPDPAFDVPPVGREAAAAHWVEPCLVAEVSFTEWTDDGRLRHPSFEGLREDKPVGSIVRETPSPAPSPASPMSQHGITITHPERTVFPDSGITKGQLADYYAAVAEHLLPHISGRPLSVVRCPQGRQNACFYQKHRGKGMPEDIDTVRIEESDGPADYLTVDSPEGLLSLIQFGVLEIHPWLSRNDRPERPDMMIFDLDPGDEVEWLEVLGAAHLLRGILLELGLESFPKVTGGKGLHLVVPIARTEDFDVVKPASRAIVELLRSKNPKRFVTTSTKAKRTGRIYLDYLRNGRGATAVAPFSSRARPGATVAAPVSSDEVAPDLRPNGFNILNLPDRLARLRKDPWDGFFSTRQTLKKSVLRELGVTAS